VRGVTSSASEHSFIRTLRVNANKKLR